MSVDKDDLKKALGNSEKADELVGQEEGAESSRKSKVDQAIQMLEEQAKFFHDESRDGYVSIETEGYREIVKIRSQKFQHFVSNLFWEQHGETLADSTLRTVINTVEGRAIHDGQEINLYNRVAWKDDELWYDLADERNRAVRINEHHWTVTEPPVLFKRYKHQKKQVKPEKSDIELNELFEVLNPCLDEDQRLLLKVQLVSNFIPGFPHPILCPHGPQGSAKTFLCRVFRDLIDPSKLETLQYSKNQKQLTQKVDHNWFVPFDNITNLPQKVSDFLCRAVTGQGFTKRELYTDDEDVIYSFQRPIALNGINSVPQKADLLDRSILYGLERIPKESRKTEDELWDEFQRMKPELLGRIFDTISEAMAVKSDIGLDSKPRMADFAEWGEAIARALGHEEGRFLEAYQRNIEESNKEAIESHVMGEPLIELMDGRTEWRDTPTKTLDKLNEIAAENNINRNQQEWPSGPQWVWRRIKEIKPELKELGIQADRLREEEGIRKIRIKWSTDVNDVNDVEQDDTNDSNDSS